MLRPLQELFPAENHPDLLVGLGTPDDAAVWRLDEARALVITTDFFTPVVDDAYAYGAIAAANALSDLYAMGARPLLALNIAALPPDLPSAMIEQIFRGGAEKVLEAGAVVAGGHSIQDKEPKFGLVAVGMAHPDRLLTKSGARPGDRLALTKPLGTGVTANALKRGEAAGADVAEATEWMSRLNDTASTLALDIGAQAVTDITGFGLLGHALEMTRASQVSFRLELDSIPFLKGARRYVARGAIAGGTADNRQHFEPEVAFEHGIDDYDRLLLFDAQTSGGLLIAFDPAREAELRQLAVQASQPLWVIGSVVPGEGVSVAAAA